MNETRDVPEEGAEPEGAPATPARRLPAVARVAAFVLIAAAFLVPYVAFGGRVLLWAVLLSAGLGAAAALVLAAAGLRAGGVRDRGLRIAACAAAFLVALAALAALPLPAPLVRALSPERHAVASAVPAGECGLGTWAEAAVGGAGALSVREALAGERAETRPSGAEQATREPEWIALSHDPPLTRTAVLVLACFLVALLALSRAVSSTLASRLVAFVVATSAVGAAAALWSARQGWTGVFGRFAPPPGTFHHPYGTFFAENHFAGLSAMLCPVALAAALDPRLRTPWRVLSIVALVPLASSVLDTGSRGGVIAGGVGAVLLGGLLLATPRRRLWGALVLAGAAAAVLLAFTLFAPRLFAERSDQILATSQGSNAVRLELYARQLEMASSAPLTGIGLGAFPTAHEVFRVDPTPILPHHGESDWLETLAEIGIPGVIAWLILITALMSAPVRRILTGRGDPWLCGLVAGSGATLAHAAIDYHHREPAVAVASLLLAAAAHARAVRLAAAEGAPVARSRGDRLLPAAIAVAAVACLALLLVRGPSLARHDAHLRAAERHVVAGELEAAREAAHEAAEAAPSRAQGWATLARTRAITARSLPPGERRDALRSEAVAAATRAIERNPAALGAARLAGQLLLAQGAACQAQRARDLALVVAPSNRETHRLAAAVALASGRPNEALPHVAVAFRGIDWTSERELRPLLVSQLLAASEGDAERAAEALDDQQLLAHYANLLLRLGHAEAADDVIGILARSDSLEGRYFLFNLLWTAAPSEHVTRLARRLEPAAETPDERTVVARALVHGGGEHEADGVAILEDIAASDEPTFHALLALSAWHAAQGRADEAAALRARADELAAR